MDASPRPAKCPGRPMRRRLTCWMAVLLFPAALHGAEPGDTDWPNVNNDKGGTRYSRLDQINRANIGELKLAWSWHTHDAGESTRIECTPIVIEGTMYVTTAHTKVAALNAANGQQLWVFDPYAGSPKPWIFASGGVNRGVGYWSDGRPEGLRRILAGLSDGRLISLDARTGRLDPAFGEAGVVDLRTGIERDISRLNYGPTSAPAVFENLVILGFSNDESMPSSPGDVRSFDVLTGKEAWRFHTVPRPGEFAGETWPNESWKERGGANPWGGFTVDIAGGIVFCGTGSVASDFMGADRPGDNLFANCVLALDARTGKRIWHFQTVHHDLWDHDNPCPPVVVDVHHEGKTVEAVAQVTKTGYCWLLDRHTGQPLFGKREIPAEASEIPGEKASPTQPAPLKPPPFARQGFSTDDVTDISTQARSYVIERLQRYAFGGPYVPPTEQGTVLMPGYHGGATWSGASFDPTTGWLYVNANNVPNVLTLAKEADGHHTFTGYHQFLDTEGYPASRPPWGTLTAIDLNTGKFAWQIPLGEHPELVARGIPPTGTENFGGTIVTAGGLVFIGGTKDERFHAFDKTTGKLLWQYQLPAGGYATPCTYMVQGRQFVAIAAGGGGKLRTRSGDSFVAFALPEARRP